MSLSDATWIASVKGLVAGSVNLILVFALSATLPAPLSILGAMLVGFFAYGVSLTFILTLRHLALYKNLPSVHLQLLMVQSTVHPWSMR